MKVSFDVVIKSGAHDVDMDYALKTLAGTSNVVCLLAEAILRGRIIERRTRANDIRAKLKHSFPGSYGQKFDIEINDPALISRLNSMGRSVFSEVMSYYICEALYVESNELTVEAQKIIDSLVAIEDELTKRIRSPLKDMHKVTTMNGYNVELSYRKPGSLEKIITLTRETDINISDTEILQASHDISVIITRFNSMTGNGRLILEGYEEDGTVAFGFYDNLRYVTENHKRQITQNLHHNNGIPSERWRYMSLTVDDMVLPSGDVIKYLIRNIP
ncbi:hypothetical protein [Yersinia enterocolitica]